MKYVIVAAMAAGLFGICNLILYVLEIDDFEV